MNANKKFITYHHIEKRMSCVISHLKILGQDKMKSIKEEEGEGEGYVQIYSSWMGDGFDNHELLMFAILDNLYYQL